MLYHSFMVFMDEYVEALLFDWCHLFHVKKNVTQYFSL